MNFRRLQFALTAADQGSFRRAAKVLDVKESSISRGVRDLEDEIGVSLFIRHSAGVHLTHAGHRYILATRAAMRHICDAAIDARSLGRGESGILRIGVFSSLASGFLARLLKDFGEKHPGVRIVLFEGGPSDHLVAIRRHRLDVAFLTGQPTAESCDTVYLWNDRIFVALPEKHDLASAQEISWPDLKSCPFIVSEKHPGPEIQDFLLKHLADFGFHPRLERHRVGRDNLMNLVAMGKGLTLTSEATTATVFPGVAFRPLSQELLPYSAVWSLHNDNPALRRLISLARTASAMHSA
ncbi:LysR family transcriptional regulator [Pararhizobium mangrovi]|uniref:LysR family transcriptional regulator n=1 Tax=Pararhizobium mangrovi TaxID=2590452 RepID=A0A506U1Q4_9HYPH|nr:LysR family transcriptional regulator [Pararhizobium mangrovi]